MFNAFVITLIAGLATFIGGLIASKIDAKNTKIIAFSLAFSAGVMIYISFVELLPTGILELKKHSEYGKTYAIIAFFLGMAIYSLIDRFLPDNSHEEHNNYHKLGWISFIAVTIHNFPEGMTVFSMSMEQHNLVWSLLVAISLHNIPEGIIIATSVFLMTKSRKKALLASLLAGLAEPIGGIIGYQTFNYSFHQYSLGLIFSFIAGMMIFLSLEQLLPQARKINNSHLISYGVMLGMLVMALST